MDGGFVWDRAKARANLRKHRVDFMVAVEAFSDPLAVIVPADSNGWREERWEAMGMLKDGTLVVVIHTYEEFAGGTRLRLISARKATRQERWEYESGNYSVREPAMTAYKPVLDDDEDVEMPEEIDFSNGVRGLHYLGPDAKIYFPVYLEPDVLAFHKDVAIQRNVCLDDYLTELLRPPMKGIGSADRNTD